MPLTLPEKGDIISENKHQLSAVIRLFNITELAELIFLQIPCIDLLRIQSVCKSFQATVGGSRKIQTVLYLKPMRPVLNKGRLLLTSNKPEAIASAFPLLSKLTTCVSLWQSPAQLILDGVNGSPDGGCKTNLFASALFLRRSTSDGGLVYQVSLEQLRLLPNTSSFKKMFVTQPPTSYLYVAKLPSVLEKQGELTKYDVYRYRWIVPKENGHRHLRGFRGEDQKVLHNPDGVTLGQLVDHFLSESQGDGRYFQFMGYQHAPESEDEGKDETA